MRGMVKGTMDQEEVIASVFPDRAEKSRKASRMQEEAGRRVGSGRCL